MPVILVADGRRLKQLSKRIFSADKLSSFSSCSVRDEGNDEGRCNQVWKHRKKERKDDKEKKKAKQNQQKLSLIDAGSCLGLMHHQTRVLSDCAEILDSRKDTILDVISDYN